MKILRDCNGKKIGLYSKTRRLCEYSAEHVVYNDVTEQQAMEICLAWELLRQQVDRILARS